MEARRDPGREPPSSDLSGLETRELVMRCKGGDRGALELLFERHYARVHRIVRVRMWGALSKREELEDVVQRVMARALVDLDSYEARDDARFVDWLARLAQHEIANLRRHHEASKRDARRDVAIEELRPHGDGSGARFEPGGDSTGVLDRLSRAELAAIVDECLAELPESSREVILLRDYAGGSWSWIAETLDRPSADAARKSYARSMATLGVEVQRRVGGGESD